ncbi:MAG TPA: alkaline phosphatase family protein [Candidatus Acidoferrum sp.]
MSLKKAAAHALHGARLCLATVAMAQFSLLGPLTSPVQAQEEGKTKTPIQHVIIIVGENRSFDHLFATYQPKKGEKVDNLLSKHIIKADGSPDVGFGAATQYSADDFHAEKFQTSPQSKSLYETLPPPLVGGPMKAPISTVSEAMASENGLDPAYYVFLTTGGTNQTSGTPDQRIQNVLDLPPGPFQLTSDTFPYNGYAASPVHRFYQMWQQLDCNVDYATAWNPTGCKSDLFPWVEVTVGAGTNGKPQASTFTDLSTGEGSTSMGFYNMAQGDAAYTKFLADNYALSDNYHQPAKGGTGLDSLYLGFADAIWFSDANFNPATPPHKVKVWADQPKDAGVVDEIENPDPQPGTNNWYTEDGYGAGGFGKPVSGGGSYSNCSDSDAPGVAAVLTYLSSLPYQVDPKCDPGHYYLLNNYNPGYFGDGSNAYLDHNVNNTPFTIPPVNQRSIADVMLEQGVSWKYYADQWNAYLGDKYQLNFGTVGKASDQYCNICNPFQYQQQVMGDPNVRTAHLKDTTDLYNDIKAGTLPAVSYVKPSGWVDGHPASSKWNLFEGFVKKIVDEVQSNKELWATTAIFVTVDEGGGYYDSGYVQALDFFGDGTRIPLIVVSPFTKPGHISHSYTDHVSIIKFVEYNWSLPTITKRSRDNLPNPKSVAGNPYVPKNSPAIGDLTDMFNFGNK